MGKGSGQVSDILHLSGIMSLSCAGDLTSDDLFDILSELHPIRSKWYNFGLGLRLKSHDLDANPGKDASECLREVLKLCLVQINPRPSWEGIVKALRSEAVNEKPLAEKLEQTYCPRSRARASSTSVQGMCTTYSLREGEQCLYTC